MDKVPFLARLGMAGLAVVVAVALAGSQSMLAQPLALIAALGALLALGTGASSARKPERVRVKAESPVPPVRRNR